MRVNCDGEHKCEIGFVNKKKDDLLQKLFSLSFLVSCRWNEEDAEKL